MPNDKGEISMFKKIEVIDEILDEHGKSISELQKLDSEKTESIRVLETQFTSIKTDFTHLENTIWKTAQSTQDLLTNQNTQQWDLIKTINGGNQAEKVRKDDLARMKTESFWLWIGKATALLLGSGGILYALLGIASK